MWFFSLVKYAVQIPEFADFPWHWCHQNSYLTPSVCRILAQRQAAA
jgi:hypothetical protein